MGGNMSQEALFRIILTILFLVGISTSIYFRSKANRTSRETPSREGEGKFLLLSLRLGGLFLWLSVLVYLINPAWMAWASITLPLWLRWTGLATGMLAVALLFWMFRSLGSNITDTVAVRREHSLVTHGPYRWIRHPLYSFGTLFILSFGVVAGNWFIAVMAVAAFVLLAQRTPIEEAKLLERFGEEYQTYMNKTGRFLPRIRVKLAATSTSSGGPA
jgi:protein-S-isoprenylcysteine O-methyltransferase Ste14